METSTCTLTLEPSVGVESNAPGAISLPPTVDDNDDDAAASSLALTPRARLDSLGTGVRAARASMRGNPPTAGIDLQQGLLVEAAQLPAYAGEVPRPRTEMVLKGMPTGTYLLRTSPRSVGVVLSVVLAPGQYMHAIVKRASGDQLLLNDKPLPHALSTMPTALAAFSSELHYLGVLLTASLRSLLESQVSDDDYVHAVSCSRQDAEALLKRHGRVGGFLLRRRQQIDSLGLSVLAPGDVVVHHLLRNTPRGLCINDGQPLAHVTTLSNVVDGLKEGRFKLNGSFDELVLPTDSTES